MAKKLTKAKAREILHDKEVHGHPLTDKQRRFFGAIAGGAKPYKAQNGIEGTMGGLTDIGFNYNGAWNGPSMQDGGILQPPMAGANQTIPMAQNGLVFLEPNSPKLPRVGESSELAMSIGGEGGEPAYLIPTMKYGRMQVDPLFEFKRTGEHLGGPFKTWQEADEWERTIRHPYVEKGESIPTPLRRWGKEFAMGGTLPGMTGFMYARTQNPAPSKGPYGKKTMASAQNGQEMKYYQQGLDFKPKTISKNGGWLEKYNDDDEIPEAQYGDLIPSYGRAYLSGRTGDIPVQTGAAEQLRQVGMRKAAPAIQAEKTRRAQIEAEKKARAREVNIQAAEKLTPEQEAAIFQTTYERNKQIASQNPDEILFNYRTGETARKGDVPAGGDWGTVNVPAIVQSAALTTPSGSNIAAGQIGAETFVNMNPITAPIMAAGRATQAALGQDPYGFSQSRALGTLGVAGDVLGLGSYKLLPGSSGIAKIPGQVTTAADRLIFPTRAYRAEPVGGSRLSYEPSPLSQKVFEKGDWATKNIGELFEYAAGTPGSQGRPGLLSGRDVMLTEYKVPFWKRNIRFDKDVMALKESQGYSPMEVSASEYIIPKNKFLYPRRTSLMKAVPEELKTDPLYSPSSIPLSYSSSQYASAPYKYIQEQINAITGHRAPLTYEFQPGVPYRGQNVPMFEWKQPQFAPEKGVGKFSGLKEYLTEQTPLKNAYKLNPWAFKSDPEAWYRMIGKKGYEDALKSGVIRANPKNINLYTGQPTYKAPIFSKGVPADVRTMGKSMGYEGPYMAEVKSYPMEGGSAYGWPSKTIEISEPSLKFYKQDWLRGYKEVPKQFEEGGIVKDNMGYWNPQNWGKVVEIDSPYITMKGVDVDLIGVSDTGDVQYMEPGEDYTFDGTKVTEYPIAAQGVSVNKADEYPLKKLDNLLNFTNYNKKAKTGGWLDKYN